MWKLNPRDRKLQLGVVATQAFIDADRDEFRNKTLSIASDSVRGGVSPGCWAR